MTITLTEIALLAIAGSMFAAVIALYSLGRRLGEAADETKRTMGKLGELTPRLEDNLTELNGELKNLQALTRRTESVVGNVEAVTGEARAAATALRIARRTQAAMAGAKAGFETLRDMSTASSSQRNGGTAHESTPRDRDREERNERLEQR